MNEEIYRRWLSAIDQLSVPQRAVAWLRLNGGGQTGMTTIKQPDDIAVRYDKRLQKAIETGAYER